MHLYLLVQHCSFSQERLLEGQKNKTKTYLDITVDDIVVMAVAKCLQDLSHVVTDCIGKHKHIENETRLKRPKKMSGFSPGNRFAVDEACICSFHNLKAKICSVHTKNRQRQKERHRERISVAFRPVI